MMNKIIVDTNNSIKFSQTIPVDVVAVQQSNISQNMLGASAINKTPKPVNIKIKVKNKEEMARGLGVTLPKFSTTGPKKVRLVSSDQTIISFELFMETENDKKLQKKTHYKFFEFFKPSGCFNSQSDDDVYPYKPGPSNETYNAKSASQVNDLQDDKTREEKFALKKNPESMLPANIKLKTSTFLGKCKPGGCLDPPFSEDNYIYIPNKFAIDQKLTEKLDLDEKNYKDLKHRAKYVNKADISSLDSTSKSSIEKNRSRSLITYPPALSSSDIRDQDEIPSKKLKLIPSTENNIRLSINEFSDTYYMPPKKQKSENDEKRSAEISEILNIRCENYDIYSLTSQKEGQKKERTDSSKNELYNQAKERNLINPQIKERCRKNSEIIFLNDDYNANVGEIVKIQTLKISSTSISDCDTNLDIIEDTVVKKIKIANSQKNIEESENREDEPKIGNNVFETNLDNSSITSSSIFENKMLPENLPTIAKDSQICPFESNFNEVLCNLKSVPDKSVDNHLLISKEENKSKLFIQSQSLKSYWSYNSDETIFEPLLPPDEAALTSSQIGVIERSSSRTDSTKLTQMKGQLLQNKKSDHLSIQERIKDREHKECDLSSVKEQNRKKSVYPSITEQIQGREYKKTGLSSVKEQLMQMRESRESNHSFIKEETRVGEDKESDILSIKEQTQDRKHDNYDPSVLKDQIQDRENKEYDYSSSKEQIQDIQYKEFHHSCLIEQKQDKEHEESANSSLKKQTLVKEGKEFSVLSVREQIQDRKHDNFGSISLKDQIQCRECKESDHLISKEQIQDRKHHESDHSFIKEQIKVKEDKKFDYSSLKEQTLVRKEKEFDFPCVKEQINDRKNDNFDHSFKNEQLQDKRHKISDCSSLEEQIQVRENKENYHLSLKEQTQVREDKKSDLSSVKEQKQDRKYDNFEPSPSKEQIQYKEHKKTDYSSAKERIHDIEITDVNQKDLQQNRFLQDVDNDTRDKNTIQNFAILMLSETAEELSADQKSNNGTSSEKSPLFQEKISSTLQKQKEVNNDLSYYANKTSLATSQIMKVTRTLTSSTLPSQKKDTIGNGPVVYENKHSLAASQIIKPTSSLNLTKPPAFTDKISSILQTQEKHTSEKYPEYYENNIESTDALKLPINLSDRTTTPTDNLIIQRSDDDIQGLNIIVPIIKNSDDHRYGLFNKDIIIGKEKQSKVTSILADYDSSDFSACLKEKVENKPQIISEEYLSIYQKSSHFNISESYPESSKKAVEKDDKINVIDLEEDHFHEKSSIIEINLGFYTYVNNKNETVIKSFDTYEYLKIDPRAKITIIKSIIQKSNNGIRIPVNSEIDLTLQIKKTLDVNVTKNEPTRMTSKKSSDNDSLLQETVQSVYENLVPIENLIRNLKQEAGFLAQQQILLRETLNTMKTTSMKIINTNNKMCTCNRYFI